MLNSMKALGFPPCLLLPVDGELNNDEIPFSAMK